MAAHHHSMDSTTVIGTIGGTALTIIKIETTDVIKTVVLAALGAVVSFLVSKVLGYAWTKFTAWLKRVSRF